MYRRRLDADQPPAVELRKDGLHVDDHQPKSASTSDLGPDDRLDHGGTGSDSLLPRDFVDADLSMQFHAVTPVCVDYAASEVMCCNV